MFPVQSVVGRYGFVVIVLAARASTACADGALAAAHTTRAEQMPCRTGSSPSSPCEADDVPHAHVALDPILEARTCLQRAQTLTKAGKFEDAVLQLRSVEQRSPNIADRIALQRGELLRALNLPAQACDAFAIAVNSPASDVALRARIGGVFCALESGDKKGEPLLRALLDQYPRLTQRDELEFALGMAHERRGDRPAAAAVLRQIDLDHPTSPVAERARIELARLKQLGLQLEPETWQQRVQRAEHVLRSGPIELAASEIEALRPDARDNPALSAQLERLDARVARIKARFEQAELVARSAQPREWPSDATGSGASALAAAGESPQALALANQIARIRGNRPIARLKDAEVRQLLELAIDARNKPLCDELLGAARVRPGFGPRERFDLAMRATGVGDELELLAMLETLLDAPGYQVKALYHHARTLERLGRLDAAEREFHGVIARERNGMRYYSMWSNMRLGALQQQLGASCDSGAATQEQVRSLAPDAASDPDADADAVFTSQVRKALGDSVHGGSAWELLPESAQRIQAALADARASAELVLDDPELLRARCLQLMTPLVEAHAAAYPWLPRARQLIELGRFGDASDEISEAYMAWRDATGAARMRWGLSSLWSGKAPARPALSAALRQGRLALDLEARIRLGQVATLLGDPSIAFGVGSADETEPRAYAELVDAAARRHGLDPELLFAVMRVESAYNCRVQSGAGAVGLMQIMPLTGRRIASRMGIDDFDPSQLLHPERNLEFAAWYLASLLQRFEGRLPLAIAAYNGGPHNVRLWMRNTPSGTPLDTFLERIPFKETRRYVRKVLSFFVLYRTQKTLPVAQLPLALPQLGPDEVAF